MYGSKDAKNQPQRWSKLVSLKRSTCTDMSTLKQYRKQNVLDAAIDRINYTFDNFEKVYISFSGGKDSTVMMHLVMDQAIKRVALLAF